MLALFSTGGDVVVFRGIFTSQVAVDAEIAEDRVRAGVTDSDGYFLRAGSVIGDSQDVKRQYIAPDPANADFEDESIIYTIVDCKEDVLIDIEL